LLTTAGITKRFGRTIALDRVDFAAAPGTIHALIGENGAGKSTLINILAGRIDSDGGTITLDGAELRGRSPAARLRAGVAAVFQSPMLFERLSWEENLALGSFTEARARIDLTTIASRARTLGQSLGLELPPSGTPVAALAIGDRVRLEILRALSFTPRVLILDEPTSVLAPAELARFLEMLRRLRGEGRIVILVTHKLAEALAVADDVTILRAGRKVAECRTAATDEAELARLMIGELAPQPPADLSRASDATALTLENIVVEDRGRRVLDSISLRIDRGEIVGVAGVDGNGQAELAAVLAGIVEPSSGSIQTAREDGVAVIPQNRDREGLILAMTLAENLLLARPLREKFTGPSGLMRSGAISDFCATTLTEYAIRAPGPDTIVAALSGGNRQRLTVARALAGDPCVIVAHDICRGLDLRATAELHRRLRNYAAAGGAVLLISSDLEEIFALCRRIYVMSGGRLREISSDNRNPQWLGLLMSGAAS
jgi:ABC-type uncharacterized transport system ATPase subunit